jgi:hypothetical protein
VCANSSPFIRFVYALYSTKGYGKLGTAAFSELRGAEFDAGRRNQRMREGGMAGATRGVAGAAALLATLGLLTLVAHSRSRPVASELLRVPANSPKLWLGEHW